MPNSDLEQFGNAVFGTFFGVQPFGDPPAGIDPATGRPPGVPSSGSPDPFTADAGDYLLGIFDNREDRTGQAAARKKVFSAPFELLLPGRYVKAVAELITGEIPGDSRPAKMSNTTSERVGQAEIEEDRIRQAQARAVGPRLMGLLVSEGVYAGLSPELQDVLQPGRRVTPRPTRPAPPGTPSGTRYNDLAGGIIEELSISVDILSRMRVVGGGSGQPGPGAPDPTVPVPAFGGIPDVLLGDPRGIVNNLTRAAVRAERGPTKFLIAQTADP